MVAPGRLLLSFTTLIVLSASFPCRAQFSGDFGRVMTEMQMHPIEKQEWKVFGRVTNVSGEAISGAKVRIDIGAGFGTVKETETDLMGRFSADYSLLRSKYETLQVKLLVTKPDYREASITAEFSAGKTWGIEVTLLHKKKDPEQLSLDELIERLAPRLRANRDDLPEPVRRKYDQGAEELFDKQETAKATAHLVQLAGKQTECVDCALLASLALLEAGDWTGADKLAAAARDADKKAPHPRPEPSLILGVMESWKHETARAAGFFAEALKARPDDPMALEEFGRSQLQLDRNEVAEEYLAKAIKAGAPADARLLRVRALMEMNDPVAADGEMKEYIGDRNIKDLPMPVRVLHSKLQGRLELIAYGKGKSFVSEPLEEVQKAAPELKGLKAAESQDRLSAVLQMAGKSVADFFSNFPDTVSIERVEQQILKKGDKPANRSTQTFKYLLLTTPEEKGLGLEEYRTNDQGQEADLGGLDKGLMLTTGFASASLFFHPVYQSETDFRLLGTQDLGGHRAEVVAFAQNPKRARISELFHGGKESALVLVQGIAWVDSKSGQILRLRTDLLEPVDKVRLARQTTEIEYGPVAFKQVSKEFWLPRDVVVTVDWKGRRFRNEHGYSDFQLFHVRAEEKRRTSELQQELQGPGK